MMSVVSDPSDEQRSLPIPSSAVAQEWKCRGCGFVNTSRDAKCQTCQAPKPTRPYFETRISYTKRETSKSPPVRRSRSPSEETLYNRPRRTSPSGGRRKSSSASSPDENRYSSSKHNFQQKSTHSSKFLSLFSSNQMSLM